MDYDVELLKSYMIDHEKSWQIRDLNKKISLVAFSDPQVLYNIQCILARLLPANSLDEFYEYATSALGSILTQNKIHRNYRRRLINGLEQKPRSSTKKTKPYSSLGKGITHRRTLRRRKNL